MENISNKLVKFDEDEEVERGRSVIFGGLGEGGCSETPLAVQVKLYDEVLLSCLASLYI